MSASETSPLIVPVVGIGSDVHAFAPGRPMRLACLDWPGVTGLDGHSDADVAAHAVCDDHQQGFARIAVGHSILIVGALARP